MSFANRQPATSSQPAALNSGRTLRIEPAAAQSSSPAQATRAFLIVIRSGADLGTHVFIEEPVTLGRDPGCTVTLHDFGVSRRHALIAPAPDGCYILRDLGSTNGTLVNDQPVAGPHVLRDGEKISVGQTVLRFALADKVDIDFHSEVASLVSTDPLTGLPSKRRFDRACEFALQAAVREHRPLAVLMMDMDGLKQINDSHGHLFGAWVIGETGRLIAEVIGDRGQACRFGGDEFSAFLPALDTLAACDVAEQIRHRLESAGFRKDGISLQPTISIGVASYPESGRDLLQLVTGADAALYRAKGLGKNRVATWPGSV
jgi:diguanylate cyclase (GGDEF)-like protein